MTHLSFRPLGMRMGLVLVLLALAACGPAPEKDPKIALKPSTGQPAYDYPIDNPYAATIIGMPPDYKLDYSDTPKPTDKTITIFPDREAKIPEGFWYERGGLRYSELLQPHAATVVYVIAGTGGDNKAEKMRTLANILYNAGFHVVLLPSPTSQNFIVNASSNFIVGRPIQGAEDMYRVMTLVDADIAKRVQINNRLLTGYSLGAMDAAFVAKVDDQQRVLNFARVLLINPPYSLYSSMEVINRMLYADMPHGMDDADRFIKTALLRLSSASQSGDPLDFQNERGLLEAYQKYKPDDTTLASLIGLSFQLSAASIAFDADVMSHTGYIFPKNKDFTTGTDLTKSMSLALRTSFLDYFNEYYTRRLQVSYPGMTKADLVAESNLTYLDGYIRNNPKFGLITNIDDIILAHGEVYKLAGMFGKNAFIFNNGGHLGNLAHPTVGYDIVWFLKGGSAQP